jgi:hypothetical protein
MSRRPPALASSFQPNTKVEPAVQRGTRVSDDVAAGLGLGESYSFADWPNPNVPRFGAGVYTVWHHDGQFIYVGMSGRGITDQAAIRNSPLGLYTRLASHASGRRSGDQFCVYVADRLVLPTLSPTDIEAISSGQHQMDAFVRRYIHQNLRYRFLMVPDGATGYRIEAAIRNGDWVHGRPMLNPARLR